jgi:hypothetical protein
VQPTSEASGPTSTSRPRIAANAGRCGPPEDRTTALAMTTEPAPMTTGGPELSSPAPWSITHASPTRTSPTNCADGGDPRCPRHRRAHARPLNEHPDILSKPRALQPPRRRAPEGRQSSRRGSSGRGLEGSRVAFSFLLPRVQGPTRSYRGLRGNCGDSCARLSAWPELSRPVYQPLAPARAATALAGDPTSAGVRHAR